MAVEILTEFLNLKDLGYMFISDFPICPEPQIYEPPCGLFKYLNEFPGLVVERIFKNLLTEDIKGRLFSLAKSFFQDMLLACPGEEDKETVEWGEENILPKVYVQTLQFILNSLKEYTYIYNCTSQKEVELMAVRRDILMVRGDVKTLVFKFRDAKTGNPLDISGYKFTLSVKSDINSNEYILSNQTTVYDGSSGQAIIEIDTRNMNSGKYYYDIQMETPHNIIKTMMIGNLILEEDVTK